MIAHQSPLTLKEFFTQVYRPKKLSRCRARTVTIYRGVFDRFREYIAEAEGVPRAPLLADLTEDRLEGYIGWRFDQGRSAHTVDKERDKLIAIANFAARKHYLDEFIDVEPIDLPDEPPVAMRIEQIRLLIDASKLEQETLCGVPAALWWEALFRVVFGTGERTEATLLFDWENVNLDELWIRSPGVNRKGGRKGMVYPITQAVAESLRKIKRSSGLVFAHPWKAMATFYGRLKRISERAGLPSGRRWKLQCIRRSHASYFKRAGGDATEKLGHDSPKTTREGYIDPTIANDNDAVRGRLIDL